MKSFDEYRSGYCKISNIGPANIVNGKFNVHLADDKGVPLAHALISYGGDRDTANKYGIVSLTRGLDTTISISFVGIDYQASLRGFDKTQNVQIEIVLQDPGKHYLNDEVWTVRKNMVISPQNKKLVRSHEL